MEKRTIIALVLTIAILFVFQMYFTPKSQQPDVSQQKTEQVQTKDQEQQKAQSTIQEVQKGIKGKPLKGEPTKRPLTKPVTETKEIFVETPLLKITFLDVGGGIKSVKLKNYKETVKDNKEKEMVENIMPYIFTPKVFKRIQNEIVDDGAVFKPDKTNLYVTNKEDTLVFTGTLTNGTRVIKKYRFYPDSYAIDMDVEVESSENDKTSVDLVMITGKKESNYTFKGPFYFNGKKFEQIEKLEKEIEIPKDFKYAGLDDGFFAFIYIPQGSSLSPLTILKQDPKSNESLPILRLSMDKPVLSAKLYFGPKKSDILAGLNVKAEKIVDFGWFDVIAKPLIMGLNLSNKVTHNYGIDIILLTILIKIIFYPLSVKSYKSMKEMQKLQPQIAKLKEKYKDDKQKLNQEMMEIYKRKGVNPMGGCLPMIIQIPVFFALYKALSGAIELRHAPFMFWINDLSAPEDLFSFTVMGFTIPIRILPLIMGITQMIQQKMTPTSVDPMQEKMMLFMPIFFTFLFWGFPSGLVLYWLVNNVISIGQQYYINKKVS
ncbi:MAG TPA: membrane protein insertase YidC [Syntrophorhabdaceae bacterium]|nr:membrane protein insertase YidC [Syntrophorhabdaceae bacterium]HOS06269.1 membrane protein insertase YidC [Syntrophorhabdaceae bacterium]HPL41490.1 membrane protein insertase YidC [Syntrophorhabdaceae bacterium]